MEIEQNKNLVELKKFYSNNKEIIWGATIAGLLFAVFKTDKDEQNYDCVQNEFLSFHNKIKLTREDELYRKARELDDSITKEIVKAFNGAGYQDIKTFIQGSFSTNTAIKSIDEDYDVDKALIITSNAPKDPLDCKTLLNDILIKRGFKNSKVKNPCVTANYCNLNLHIDYPIYRENCFFKGYQLATGKRYSKEEKREWVKSEPKELIEWINSKTCHTKFFNLTNDEHAQFRRLVKYVKRWRDVNFTNINTRKKIYSIGLTIMMKESFCPSIENKKENDLFALYKTIKYILDDKDYFDYEENGKYNINVELPTYPYSNVFEKHGTTVGTEFRNKILEMKNNLKQVIDEEDFVLQCKTLNVLFGNDFSHTHNKLNCY